MIRMKGRTRFETPAASCDFGWFFAVWGVTTNLRRQSEVELSGHEVDDGHRQLGSGGIAKGAAV
jgi:hypothetical protein